MRIKVLLSSHYDLDIIDMIHNNIDVKSIIKDSLYSLANNLPITLGEVPINKKACSERFIQISISDKPSIELLSQLVQGQKAIFLKQLLRYSYNTPYIQCYFRNSANFVCNQVNNAPITLNVDLGQNLTRQNDEIKRAQATSQLPVTEIHKINTDKTKPNITTTTLPPEDSNSDNADILDMFDNLA